MDINDSGKRHLAAKLALAAMGLRPLPEGNPAEDDLVERVWLETERELAILGALGTRLVEMERQHPELGIRAQIQQVAAEINTNPQANILRLLADVWLKNRQPAREQEPGA